jgi:membrane protein
MAELNRVEKFLWNLPPIRWLRKWSARIHPPGFGGLSLLTVFKFFVEQINRVGINERAAAISFNFLMAIPAACIFLFTLVPYFPVSKKFNEELLVLTADLTPNQGTYELVANFLNDFLNTPRSGLLSIGFLLAVFYASNAIMGIMRSFDRSLIPVKKRNFITSRWMAIRLTALFMLLVIASVFLLITQGQILNWTIAQFDNPPAFLADLIRATRWLIIAGLFFFSIAFIYKYGPSVHKRWTLFSPGTVLCTFLIMATTYGFSFWVNNFNNFNKIYGSIGTILILMLLIYLNSLILLIGFELNVSITFLKRSENKETTD